MKAQFLKMGGVTSEEEFYNKFPTEESFFAAYPEAEMMKGGGTFSGNTYYQKGGDTGNMLDYNTWKIVNNKFFGIESDFERQYEDYINANSMPVNQLAPINNNIKASEPYQSQFTNLTLPATLSAEPVKKKRDGLKNYMMVNAGLDAATGMANLFSSRDREMNNYMQSQTMADNLYPVKSGDFSGSQGNYAVTGSGYGQFRPDQMGAKSPDGMYNGMFYPQMQEGGEIELTADEIMAIQAAGGEVEFL